MFLPSTRVRFRGPLLGCLLALALATSAFAQDAKVTLLHASQLEGRIAAR
jgi:hypothetical protein